MPDKYYEAVLIAQMLLESAEFSGSNIWDNGNLRLMGNQNYVGLLEQLKFEIKEYLFSLNSRRCTYCFRLGETPGDFCLDHFVSKRKGSGFGRYSYFSLNLILSCWDCNRKKGQWPTIKKNAISGREYDFCYEDLPFSVFHPYLDLVEDHFHVNSERLSIVSELAANYLDMLGFLSEGRWRQLMHNLSQRDLNTEEQKRLDEISGVRRVRMYR